MAFDLSAVMASALEAKAQQESNNNGGPKGPKLVYPQDGTLRVKLLFNPASGLVSRKILRHAVEGTKAPCLSAYGQQCPICSTVTSIQNSKGIDLWKLKASTRGISFAQYISSDYKWNKPEDEPAPGEVILLMYPWTIYQDINRIIADAGQMAATVVASNTGKIVKISRWMDKSQVKYKAEIDAFGGDYTSCQSEDDFNKLLTDMESLNDKIMPATISDDIIKQAREMSDQLTASYLGGQVVQPTGGAISGFGFNNPQPNMGMGGYPQQPTYQQPPVHTPSQPQQPAYQPPSYEPVPQPSYQPPVAPPGGYAPTEGFGAGFAPTAPGASALQQPQTPVGGQAPNVPAGAPQCYGTKNSGGGDANRCLICPHELLCSQVK